jgi:hypothetical protein
MVGLPDSGKSTYLAAIFHALRHGEEEWKLGDLPQQRDYLLGLENKWLALEPVGHSAYPTPRDVQLSLVGPDDAQLEIQIPDINGEDFQQAWESGRWSPEAADLVERAEALMLFVRANHLRRPKPIEVYTERSAPASTPDDWTPKLGTTQAQLCDLCEQIAERRAGQLPPMALVVSAWDAVEDDQLTPAGWLNWKLPLLDQWLRASRLVGTYRVFGVSAQGGNIEDARTRERLAQLPRTGRPGGFDALTDPLHWLIRLQ